MHKPGLTGTRRRAEARAEPELSPAAFRRSIGVALLCSCLSVSACGTFGGYWKDRARDAADIASVEVGAPGLGVEVFFWNFSLGFVAQGGASIGLRGGQFGIQENPNKLFLLGFAPQTTNNGIKEEKLYSYTNRKGVLFVREKAFGDYLPGPQYLYGRFGVRVCVLLCVYADVNLFEFFDFAFGFLGADVLKDDVHLTQARLRRQSEQVLRGSGSTGGD